MRGAPDRAQAVCAAVRRLLLIIGAVLAVCLFAWPAGAWATGTTPSTTSLSASPNPATTGQTVTLTATVSGSAGTPTGTVDFKNGGSDIANCSAQPLTSGTATCTTTFSTAGSPQLSAVYSGDSSYAGSTGSPTTPLTVVSPSTTALTSNRSQAVTNQPVTLTAKVTASGTLPTGAAAPTGTVEFLNGANPIPGCSAQPLSSGVASCQTHFDAGTQQLTATYTPDSPSGYAASSTPKAAQITVTKAPPAMTLKVLPRSPIRGQPVTFTATVKPKYPGTDPTGTVSFRDGKRKIRCASGDQSLTAAGSVSKATCTVTYRKMGTHHITASYSGDPNFKAGRPTSSHTVTVLKPPPAILAITGQAVDITRNGARLTGTVKTGDVKVAWQFWYGETGFPAGTLLQGLPAARHPIPVSAQLTSLRPGTTYQFRLVVLTVGRGHSITSLGNVETFTTPPS